MRGVAGQDSHTTTAGRRLNHEPEPDDSRPTTGEQDENSVRRFRAWASAHEPHDSWWERARARFAALFTRRKKTADVAVDEFDDEHGDVESEVPAPSYASATLNQTLDDGAVAPPPGFKFPWPRAGAGSSAPVITAAPPDSGYAPPPPPDDVFESVDDALPVDEVAEVNDTAPDTKRSLFSRLFNRTATPARDETDELEIEVHEDRIEAAAQALDEAGAEQFESFDGAHTAVPPQKFVSVDDALPPADCTTAEVSVQEIPALREVEVAPLDADEPTIEEKTDEFEIAALEGPTDPMGEVGEHTAQVERKNFWTSTLARLFRRGDTQVESVGADEEEAARASAGFLLAKFRAFYNEVIKFQHQKSEFSAGFATAMIADYTSDLSPDAAAEALSKRLSELLELQAAEAKWMGGEAAERYPDAQYAMAALADELFTFSEWEGQASWPTFSLERKLHHSTAADVELFRRMDTLLKESPDSPIARDLARVYLLVLGAGFQGKWRPFELVRPVAEYRRRLYEYIYGTDPLMLYSSDRKVFPAAASRTLQGHAVSRFTAAQRWAAILVVLVVTYAVVAHLAWARVSADLKDVTARIQTGTAATGAR